MCHCENNKKRENLQIWRSWREWKSADTPAPSPQPDWVKGDKKKEKEMVKINSEGSKAALDIRTRQRNACQEIKTNKTNQSHQNEEERTRWCMPALQLMHSQVAVFNIKVFGWVDGILCSACLKLNPRTSSESKLKWSNSKLAHILLLMESHLVHSYLCELSQLQNEGYLEQMLLFNSAAEYRTRNLRAQGAEMLTHNTRNNIVWNIKLKPSRGELTGLGMCVTHGSCPFSCVWALFSQG